MHVNNEIRQAFEDWIDAGQDPTRRDAILAPLYRCTDIMPAILCDQLDLPPGSTYARAVRALRKES